MPKGQKTCSHCGTHTGPRAFTCPKCNQPFAFAAGKGVQKPSVILKKKRLHAERIDWRTLKPGEYIKVLSGSGPFWKRKNGEREPMGYYGRFRVHHVDDNGIHAYPTDTKNSGHCYIYMGMKYISPHTGLYNRPHKIRKINKPSITNIVMKRYEE